MQHSNAKHHWLVCLFFAALPFTCGGCGGGLPVDGKQVDESVNVEEPKGSTPAPADR